MQHQPRLIISVRQSNHGLSPAMPICDSLGKRASAVEATNAIKVNQTVHAPWFDRVFRAVATPMYPLPATSTYLSGTQHWSGG